MNTGVLGIQALSLSGRCLSGAERGRGTLYHGVQTLTGRALCGAAPGRHSGGWSWPGDGEQITCPKCLKKLSLLQSRSA
jgi:hypothetical protein